MIPRWLDSMPRAAPGRLPETRRDGAAAVYLPACINRMFGPPAERSLARRRAGAGLGARGKPVWIPPDVAGVCCGTPMTSKGYSDGART